MRENELTEEVIFNEPITLMGILFQLLNEPSQESHSL